jgi:hypothetical protein
MKPFNLSPYSDAPTGRCAWPVKNRSSHAMREKKGIKDHFGNFFVEGLGLIG